MCLENGEDHRLTVYWVLCSRTIQPAAMSTFFTPFPRSLPPSVTKVDDMNLSAEFRKSSYSNASQNCVEVADLPGTHLVRDTQNRDKDTLSFDDGAWSGLLGTLRASARTSL